MKGHKIGEPCPARSNPSVGASLLGAPGEGEPLAGLSISYADSCVVKQELGHLQQTPMTAATATVCTSCTLAAIAVH